MTDPSRRSRISPLELRLYIVALLAAVYVVSWRAIAGAPAPVVASTAPVAPTEPAAPTTSARPAATWLEDLPPSQRPALVVPTGWRVVSRASVATTTATPPTPTPIATRVVRAPVSRPLRVRTRSS